MPSERPEIAIIGPGKVGTALGVLSAQAGWRVSMIGARRLDEAKRAAVRIGGGAKGCGVVEAASACGVVLLTVSDSAIEEVCRSLADAGALQRGSVVAHCCGALGSDVLQPARDMGCLVASAHPLQTFPSVERAVESLSQGDTFCFCEGDAPALALLEELMTEIGTRVVRIASEGKPLYHAAGIMASNYLAALADASLALCEAAKIAPDHALHALVPLMRATLKNIAEAGPVAALTGPIARGDVGTVRRHLVALDGLPQLEDLYRAGGRWTVGLAQRKGTLDATTAQKLSDVLEERKDIDDREDH
jgi:predicted short-subunit dehydrogenase-like oxidoreductase (DUF2520 family)